MQLSKFDCRQYIKEASVLRRRFFPTHAAGLAIAASLLATTTRAQVNAAAQQTAAQQAAVAGPLTLASAIEQAESKYPAIAAAQQREQAARAAIGIAKTAYLPRADVLWQTSRSTTNRPNVAIIPQPIVPIPSPPARPVTGHSDWNTAAGVLLAWQPFDFGQRASRVGVARYGYESAQHASELSKLDVAASAAGAFLDVVAAKQNVVVQQANVNRMEEFAKAVHVLVENTLRPGADASQADAQLAMARTQLIEAQTREQVALEALANFLQVPAQGIVIDDKAVLGDAGHADVAGAAGLEVHPAAEQQGAFLKEQQEQLRLLSRSYVPAFNLLGSASGLGAGLTSTSSNPQFQGGTAGLAPSVFNWMAAVQVTFPAMQVFTLHEQKKQQAAEVKAADAAYRQTLTDLTAHEKEAAAMLDGARRVAANTQVEVAAARQSEQQQQARYKAGLATVVEVSAAEAALAQAEGEDALAKVNVWRGLAGVAEAQGDMAPLMKLLQKP